MEKRKVYVVYKDGTKEFWDVVEKKTILDIYEYLETRKKGIFRATTENRKQRYKQEADGARGEKKRLERAGRMSEALDVMPERISYTIIGWDLQKVDE